MPTLAPYLLAGLLLLFSGAAPANLSCTAKSGDATAAFIELYTSEGCSSCPPAEAWLAAAAQRFRVPEQMVPLALHVDYWNYLGWVDPYAQSRFTERQHYWAHLNQADTIYTPQILLNGHVLSGWQKHGDQAVPRINALPARADIALALTRQDEHVDIAAEARTRSDTGQSALYIAVYERNLLRHIKAGENRGRTLRHDYVVRELLGPLPMDKSGSVQAKPRVNLKPDWKRPDLGVAAFVQVRDTGDVLQALALPLCR